MLCLPADGVYLCRRRASGGQMNDGIGFLILLGIVVAGAVVLLYVVPRLLAQPDNADRRDQSDEE
ncbi:hypothetical protein BI364_02765 [Acidihalobacter yilgarnensis]|uniref:Uncharacterized protein n=1 Tax=Acidihalobacter yilgarnensis TaxID=2819280 RepID=A0A1D8IKS3_9GAMM|nr:hypothetical protein BI364_02760 [Acidihalobacter yilgarnensis]AOU97068.1 hypothetical protein BI364_02765 [Acidihalobacter yilgarnensis]